MDGYTYYKCADWNQFLSFSQKYFADDMGFVFRGHRDSDWKLETTLDRHLIDIDVKGVDLESTYDQVLRTFAKAIRGRSVVGKCIKTNADDLWALGQHYGLKTPLLDWTESLFTAVFFAFEQRDEPKSGYRTIWAMHTGSYFKQKMALFNQGKQVNQEFKFLEPITDENPRLVSQSGLFTKQPINFDVVQWVNSHFSGIESPMLIKIDIPSNERLDILKQLKLMNVHPASLFPDVEGSSKYVNLELELLADKRKSQL